MRLQEGGCYICVYAVFFMLLYMCPPIAICVSSYKVDAAQLCAYKKETATYVSSHCYVDVFILLYMCPHTATCVSSYKVVAARLGAYKKETRGAAEVMLYEDTHIEYEDTHSSMRTHI